MNRINRYKMPGDFLFKVFPWIFGIMFVIAILVTIGKFILIGWLALEVFQDPNGSAAELGKIIGSFMEGVNAE